MSHLHLFRDTSAPLEQSDPAPDRVVAGQPTRQTINVFETGDGKVFSGIWRATIGAWRVSYDETEIATSPKGPLV